VLQTKERAPTLFPSVVFTFGLAIESIKEFGGVSMQMEYSMGELKYLIHRSYMDII
jgi:hypothetical protein